MHGICCCAEKCLARLLHRCLTWRSCVELGLDEQVIMELGSTQGSSVTYGGLINVKQRSEVFGADRSFDGHLLKSSDLSQEVKSCYAVGLDRRQKNFPITTESVTNYFPLSYNHI